MTLTPSSAPSAMTADTMAVSRWSLSSPAVKLRSIFNASMGNRARWVSEEYPCRSRPESRWRLRRPDLVKATCPASLSLNRAVSVSSMLSVPGIS